MHDLEGYTSAPDDLQEQVVREAKLRTATAGAT